MFDSILNWFDGGTRGYSSSGVDGKSYNTYQGYLDSKKSIPKNIKPPGSPQKLETSSQNNAWAAESAALNARLAALSNQLAQQPKLPNFDILANYNKAKQTASAAVNPLYDKKLTLFLDNQGIAKDRKTQERGLALENASVSERTSLEDNQTSRVRTGEDLASALEQIGVGRENYLQDDAQAFDDARRGLQEEVAAGGGTDTGLGQQQINRQLNDRNTSSERQLTAFQNEEAAKSLLANRSFEDLMTGDSRVKERRGLEEKGIQIDFDAYMSQLANEESTFRLDNDLDRAMAISSQTDSYRQQGIQEFLAGLAGSGARSQDIALAAQVYR